MACSNYVFCWYCLLFLTFADQSLSLLNFYNSSNDDVTYWYGLFDTPYANLKGGLTGYLYYYELGCNETFPPPVTNESIVVLGNYTTDRCMLRQIALAKQMGYDGFLYFREGDGTLSIPESIVDAGFPIAIIPSETALTIKEDTRASDGDGADHTDYTVTITGSIVAGVLLVSLTCFCCLFSVCCTTLSLLCSCMCYYTYVTRMEEENLPGFAEWGRTSAENAPLSKEEINALEEQTYTKPEESTDNSECPICTDEFADGDATMILPCKHMFHKECIVEWLKNYKPICPYCKFNIKTEKALEDSNATRL